ncbi:MAG TPA: RimK family alpha-L-glutamate ligase [Anaerolineae bacterium]|jgi:ribosomal protein S6--L-glutamate ligase|nr:RimK family alpha-L-glutamate ligase [Anaerolineae bacterium]
MKIALLSRNPGLYSTRRIAQAARSRGHLLIILDTLHLPVQVGHGPTAAAIEPLPDVDAIIPRIGTSITFYGLAVVRQFEAQGVVTTATSEAIARSRDKLHSLQVMSSNGLPTPNTTVVSDPNDALKAIQIAGGLPVILKLIRGTQGRGVFLAREMHTVTSVLRTVRRASEQMLVQEYIRESRGTDIRIIVVGNRCVAAMQRTASRGDFRSNLHRGGTAKPITLDEKTRRLAAKAARAHGLAVAGVDLLQSDRGPLLLEVNSSPGLEGIETATEVDVAAEIVRYLEQEERTAKHRRRLQRKGRR